MSDEVAETGGYLHGSSPEEQRRLSLLNDLLNESCLREMGLNLGEDVVDFGCGTGQFTRRMARTVGSEGRVVGIERDGDQLSEALALARSAVETSLVDFRQGDALDPPLNESEWGSFDVAHARFLLEHLPDPGEAVRQMVQAVRPGGRVFILDDDHDDFRPWPRPDGFQPMWDAYVRSFEVLGSDPRIGRRLVALLKENGLVGLRNGNVFFGGCAGDDRFEGVAENIIGAMNGARDAMLSTGLVDEAQFQAGMSGLHQWKAHPSAALWYAAYYAEGIVPGGM